MIEKFQVRTLLEKGRLFKKILGDFDNSNCNCFFSTYRFDSFALNQLKDWKIIDKNLYLFVDKKNILVNYENIKSKRLSIYPQDFLAFHSKVYLFFNEEKAHLVIGNLNLSKEGLTKNIETLIHINISSKDFTNINCINDSFNFFKKLFSINRNEPTYQRCIKNISYLKNENKTKTSEVFFLHSLIKPLFFQIDKLIDLSKITKIVALCPVFLEEGDLIPILLNKQIKINLVLQRENNNLGRYIHFENKNLSFYELDTNYLNHSKILLFYKNEKLVAAFNGSPNFTKSAFFGTKTNGNIESGVLIKGDNSSILKFSEEFKKIEEKDISQFSMRWHRYINKKELRKLVKFNQKNKTPLTLCWELTNNCPNNCYFCEVRNKYASVFSNKKYIRKLLFEAKRAGIISQWITGGEPFLEFDLLIYSINLANNYKIDTEKISTSLNFNTSQILRYFKKLSQSSFSKNNLFKGQLNIGIGHQQFNKKGDFNEKQLLSVLRGVNKFYDYFDIKRNRIKLSVTESQDLSYNYLYKKYLRSNLNQSIPVDHFDAIEKDSSSKFIFAKDFNFDSCFDCSNYFLEPCSWPMILVKSNGDIYGCVTWFLDRDNLLFLGNIKDISLDRALKKLKKDKILRFLKEKGIKSLYLLLSKKFEELKYLRIPCVSNETSKCFICRHILSNKKYLSYLNKTLK